MSNFLIDRKKIGLRICVFSILFILLANPLVGIAQTPEKPEMTDDDWGRIIEEMEIDAYEGSQANGPDAYWGALPSQHRKSGTTAVGVTVGSCIGDLLASMATGWFTSAVGDAASVLRPTLVPVYMPDFTSKEVGTAGGKGPSLDGLGFCVSNALIQAISDATIAWINGGFEGNPVFIDDLEWFLKDLKKDALGDVLNSFTDSFADGILCKELGINISLSLINNKRPKRDYKCTYNEAGLRLAQGFFDFDDFKEVTQNPMNNRIGAFLAVDSNYQELVNSRGDVFEKESNWNNGYLSWKDKDSYTKTITPGKVISDQFQAVTKLPLDRLVLADEFDEIISALVNQLVRMAVPEILGAIE